MLWGYRGTKRHPGETHSRVQGGVDADGQLALSYVDSARGGQGSHSINHVNVTSPYGLVGNEIQVSGPQPPSQPEGTFEAYS